MIERTRACAECGEQVPPKKRSGPRARYCGSSCRDKASYRRRSAAGTVRRTYNPKSRAWTCSWCGQAGESARTKRWCSNRCTNAWLDAHNPARCSEQDCERGVRAKGLCSMHWRRKARSEGREVAAIWDERRRANWKRREALKRGATESERIVHREVFERDGWACGLCAEPVDPEVAWPDPLSASLDHILPLSRGGSHMMANVQLAHLGCNVEKGARLIA